ncbi:RecB family exonuclease [Patescibacteria group bacterium]
MRISYSALNTYKTCPFKYKLQNIDRIKEPKSKEAVFGTLIHSTLNFIHKPAILSPTMEQAMEHFSTNWNADVFEEEMEERAAFSQGVEMIRRYYNDNDISKANVVALESHFAIPLENHVISGIIDRIDRTEDGYEIIDYKTAKKMPSQDMIDNDLQLSVYLKAFLSRYPEEAKNISKIKVSLYFVKHGAKLTSTRTFEQLDDLEQEFLDVISKIESEKFEPVINPLCDWCGYQKYCPMWKHKFKEERKIDSEEFNQAVTEYIEAKDQAKSLRMKVAKLQNIISDYMDQEKVERVFAESNTKVVARTERITYKYDEKELKNFLGAIDKWDDVIKVNQTMLKSTLKTLSSDDQRKIDGLKEIDRTSKSFTIKNT